MTTLTKLLLEADPASEGLLTVKIIEITDTWLSWWEREALAHVKWAQRKHIDTGPSLGRLHQIQEIREGITNDQSLDVPDSSVQKDGETK